MQEKYDESEIFLERVTAQENENVIAWTLYGILYEQKNQELNADITFKRATKLNNTQYMEMLPIVQTNVGGNEAVGEEEATKKDDADIVDDSKLLELQSKSRSSKRGTITQQTKTKSDSFSKSPKSPQGNVTATSYKHEEQVISLKERQHLADLAINKSIYLKTANFLVNNNAYSVSLKDFKPPTTRPLTSFYRYLQSVGREASCQGVGKPERRTKLLLPYPTGQNQVGQESAD